jgi:hypothetical protein
MLAVQLFCVAGAVKSAAALKLQTPLLLGGWNTEAPSFKFPYQQLLDPTNGTEYGRIINETRLVLQLDYSQFVVNGSWFGVQSKLVHATVCHITIMY